MHIFNMVLVYRMNDTIFPVETSTVTVTPATASTFEGTFLSGAVAAVAGGMSAAIPCGIAGLIAINNPDFMDYAASYCVSDILVGFLAMQLAYRAGAVPVDDYVKYLVKNWEHPVVEQGLVTWFETVKMETGLSNYFKQLPDAFVLKHSDMISNRGSPTLIFACINKNTQLALAILATGNVNVSRVNNNGNTALIGACSKSLSEVALAILATGLGKPEHINNDGNTALILACENNLSEVALAILATGLGKPEQANYTHNTALIWTCYSKMPDVALAILATGMGKPEQVNNNKNTALIYACCRNLSDVALALLATGMGNPEQTNNKGCTALTLATKRRLTTVIAELHRLGVY
jgi:hypothetical protein